MVYLVDTYAWIEYFIGSEAGRVVKRIVDETPKNQLLTPAPALGELSAHAAKAGKDFDAMYNSVLADSEIVDVSVEDWINAGKRREVLRATVREIGLIDALLVVVNERLKQKHGSSKIITGDKHFRNLRDVIFIG